MMEIIRPTCGDDAQPLYYRYPQEFDCQPAYLYVDVEDETVGFDWDAYIGNAHSAKQHHG